MKWPKILLVLLKIWRHSRLLFWQLTLGLIFFFRQVCSNFCLWWLLNRSLFLCPFGMLQCQETLRCFMALLCKFPLLTLCQPMICTTNVCQTWSQQKRSTQISMQSDFKACTLSTILGRWWSQSSCSYSYHSAQFRCVLVAITNSLLGCSER